MHEREVSAGKRYCVLMLLCANADSGGREYEKLVSSSCSQLLLSTFLNSNTHTYRSPW